MSSAARLRGLLGELDLDLDAGLAHIEGADPALPSRYPLGESVAAVLAAVGLAAGRVWELRGGAPQRVGAHVGHAAALTRGFLDQVIDGQVQDPDPTAGLPLVGLYRTGDGGWVQTYGVFSPLAERTAGVLGCDPDREAIGRAAAGWEAEDLVEALTAAGAPGAVVRSPAEWDAHPQGRAPAGRAVVEVERIGDGPPRPLEGAARPLEGLRVLDLTRIVAGPACGRTLAEHGAEVLALSAPGMPSIHRATVDTTAGKRCAELDLRSPEGRGTLDELLGRADVFCQSARPGAFARRGLGAEELAERHPGLIYASSDCYGGVGPWGDRPGFEPLAQASTGWAHDHAEAGRPTIVAALPCDYTTGFLLALGVMVAVIRRAQEGGSWHVRTSLCRTAVWLRDQPGRFDPQRAPRIGVATTAHLREPVPSEWGVLEPLRPAPHLAETPPRWGRPPASPGSAPPSWTNGSANTPGA